MAGITIDARQAVILALMPVSARMDDFLERYEYLDSKDPNVLRDAIALLNTIQKYINNMYLQLGLREQEWNELAKELNYDTTDNNDSGSSGFRQDDLGENPPEGAPQRV